MVGIVVGLPCGEGNIEHIWRDKLWRLWLDCVPAYFACISLNGVDIMRLQALGGRTLLLEARTQVKNMPGEGDSV